jgi:hypothetical protein
MKGWIANLADVDSSFGLLNCRLFCRLLAQFKLISLTL